MNELREELACSYVLGILSPEDAAAFEQELAGDAELQEFVRRMRDATLALAQGARPVKPPSSVEARLLRSLAEQGGRPLDNVIAMPPLRSPFAWLPWAAAAGLAVLCGWQWVAGNREATALRAAVAAQSEAVVREANAAKSAGDKLAAATADIQKREAEARDLQQKLATAQTALAARDAAAVELTAKLAAAEKANSLGQARIALLGSLIKDRPKAVAVSVWNQSSQDGVLVVENLPALPKGKDYQLWVIDPQSGAPISAGVFKVDQKGSVRTSIKPNRPVIEAGKFAVTVEKEGGAPAPTMSTMVVIGG